MGILGPLLSSASARFQVGGSSGSRQPTATASNARERSVERDRSLDRRREGLSSAEARSSRRSSTRSPRRQSSSPERRHAQFAVPAEPPPGPQVDWRCGVCGQRGLSGDSCTVCGRARGTEPKRTYQTVTEMVSEMLTEVNVAEGQRQGLKQSQSQRQPWRSGDHEVARTTAKDVKAKALLESSKERLSKTCADPWHRNGSNKGGPTGGAAATEREWNDLRGEPQVTLVRNKTTFKDAVQRSQSAGMDPQAKQREPPPLRPFDMGSTTAPAPQQSQTASPFVQKGPRHNPTAPAPRPAEVDTEDRTASTFAAKAGADKAESPTATFGRPQYMAPKTPPLPPANPMLAKSTPSLTDDFHSMPSKRAARGTLAPLPSAKPSSAEKDSFHVPLGWQTLPGFKRTTSERLVPQRTESATPPTAKEPAPPPWSFTSNPAVPPRTDPHQSQSHAAHAAPKKAVSASSSSGSPPDMRSRADAGSKSAASSSASDNHKSIARSEQPQPGNPGMAASIPPQPLAAESALASTAHSTAAEHKSVHGPHTSMLGAEFAPMRADVSKNGSYPDRPTSSKASLPAIDSSFSPPAAQAAARPSAATASAKKAGTTGGAMAAPPEALPRPTAEVPASRSPAPPEPRDRPQQAVSKPAARPKAAAVERPPKQQSSGPAAGGRPAAPPPPADADPAEMLQALMMQQEVAKQRLRRPLH